MRLIDADALMANIPSEEMIAKLAVAHAPTIDAVPMEQYRSMEKTCYKLQTALYEKADAVSVVRCKECKHREKYPCDEIEFYECSHLRLRGTKVGVEDDWFCADGERKESE